MLTRSSQANASGICLLLACSTVQVWAEDTSAIIAPTAATVTESSPTAREWLERMSRAAHELNYEGAFIYIHDNQMRSMHIIHKVDAQGEHGRLVCLDGAGCELIHSGSSANALPDKSVGGARSHLRRTFPGVLPAGVEKLEDYYQLTLGGEERVAGRLVQEISIKPKDNNRYGYHLWVDKDTGLLLKADMVNEEGIPIEQVMFTTLSGDQTISSVTQESVLPKAAAAASVDKPLIATSMGILGKDWQITDLPQGFELVEHNTYLMPQTKLPVEHIVLTDGLASVSVFIEQFDPKDKFMGTSRKGAVHVYGTLNHGHQITVIGEVPSAAVQLIGQSVTREGQP